MSASTATITPAAGRSFTFKNVSKNSPKTVLSQGLLEMMKGSDMVSVKEVGAFDFPNFPEARKHFRVVYFSLTEAYEGLKGIFKGITSIGLPEGVIVEYQKELNTYSLKYYLSDEEAAKSYFLTLEDIINKEVRFKSLLRTSIANQRAFESSQQLLYKEILA